MRRKNPEKNDDETKEKNWRKEDTQNPEKNPLSEDDWEVVNKTGARLITSILIFAVILIVLICFAVIQWKPQEEAKTETSGSITVTGNQDMEARLENENISAEAEGLTDEAQKEEIPEETVMEESRDWQSDIFGTGTSQVSQIISRNLELDGMTDGMRDAVNFRESDFLIGAAAFLSEQKVSVDQITIEEELPCSSDGATVYLAELQGINDQALIIILYPDYPGKFQFLLMDRGAVNNLVENAGKSAEVSQTEAVREIETTPVVTAPAQAETQAAQTEASYDATRLSIIGLPGTLDN